MMDDLTKHIQKEEKEDLVFLERNLNLDERASMGKKFSMKKKIVPTRPHPEIPDHPTMLEAALGLLMTPFDKLADLFREFPEHTDDIQT